MEKVTINNAPVLTNDKYTLGKSESIKNTTFVDFENQFKAVLEQMNQIKDLLCEIKNYTKPKNLDIKVYPSCQICQNSNLEYHLRKVLGKAD